MEISLPNYFIIENRILSRAAGAGARKKLYSDLAGQPRYSAALILVLAPLLNSPSKYFSALSITVILAGEFYYSQIKRVCHVGNSLNK
jgi:hypothetical protein